MYQMLHIQLLELTVRKIRNILVESYFPNFQEVLTLLARNLYYLLMYIHICKNSRMQKTHMHTVKITFTSHHKNINIGIKVHPATVF